MVKFVYIVIGCFVAPLVAAAIAVGLTAYKQESNYFSLIGLFPIFYLYAMGAMILLGLPLFYILFHFKFISWWSSILAGSFIGVITAAILRLPSVINLNDLLPLSVIGALSGFAFWLIIYLGFVKKNLTI